MKSLVVVIHNIRSTHNVGSILRSCDGFGVDHVVLSGYTPYPEILNDQRLPHIRDKITKQIHKTALGAEKTLSLEQTTQCNLAAYKTDGYRIVGLEQHSTSIPINQYTPPHKVVLLLGEEVDGISYDLLNQCDDIIEIPMSGTKESFNVSVATGIALYALRMA